MNRNFVLVMASLCLLVSAKAALSGHQAPQSGETVTEDRPYEPLGIRLGGFLLSPMIEVTETYDDNIFVDESDEVDDFITDIKPSFALLSNFSRHALNLSGSADIGRYADNSDENFEDYGLGFDGRIDVTSKANLSGGAAYAQKHEDRGSPDDVKGTEPTEFTTVSANAALFHEFGRFNGTLSGEFIRYDFEDVDISPGGKINQDDRDRDEHLVALRLGYEIVPEYEAYVKGSYNTRDYDAAVDDNLLNRDSDGFEVVAGARIDLTGLLVGDVFVGYHEQYYDDSALSTASGASAGASLTWTVTPLTTVRGSLSRSVVETTSAGASSYLATVVGVGVDHKLLRNLQIGASVSYENDDYEGISRSDDLFEAGLSLDYYWTRNLFVGVAYDFRSRDSDVSGGDYTQNRVMLRIGARM